MNRKGLKHIIIFLSIWILVPLFFILIDFPGNIISFLFIPVIYVFHHLFKAIEYSKMCPQSFSIALLFLLLPLKIEFHFYNFLIHLLVIIFAFYVFKRHKSLLRNSKSVISLFLIIINSILFLTPNKLIFDAYNSEKVSYTENLKWDNFQGEPEEDHFADATIVNEYRYKINRLFNYPKLVIGSYMNPKKSWKKEINSSLGSKLLLKHEQGHFDIREAYCKKIKDSVSIFMNSNEVEEIIESFMNEHEICDDKYDEETYHGSILEKQDLWNSKIEKLLN